MGERERGRQAANPPPSDVRPAIILFADLLGFSQLVSNAQTHRDAQDLARRLDHFARQFSGADFEDKEILAFFSKKYWAFSDSIVVCWYGESQAEAMMTDFDANLEQLSSLALAQALIMSEDRQLVRGGIGNGWFLEQDGIVVGDALVKAARIEKKIDSPFIGVEQELYDYYLSHPTRRGYSEDIDPTYTLFIPPCEYTNSIPALDYFMIMLGDIDLSASQMRQARSIDSAEERQAFRNECWLENRSSWVEWHRDFVTKGLQHSDIRVRRKYVALSKHHNFRAQSLYPGQAHMLVPLEPSASGRSHDSPCT